MGGNHRIAQVVIRRAIATHNIKPLSQVRVNAGHLLFILVCVKMCDTQLI
jgi:hypothetical protein